MTTIRYVALACVALIAAMATASAQTPAPIMPPSLSPSLKQYYRDHPEEFQNFLAQLAEQHRQPVAETPQVLPPVGGSWTTLTNAPPVGVSQPQVLPDGSVIAQTSCGSTWYKLTPTTTGSLVNSYINGTWTTLATLPVISGTQYAPTWYAAQVLPDGRFLINGGEYNACVAVQTNMGAIYDPMTNAWTAVTPPSGWTQIGDAQSIVLANGTYMLANSQSSTQSALLNPYAMTWTATGTGKADRYDEEGWTLLPNGKVLTVDASCGDNSELYDPATGAWSTGGNTIVQLPDCNGKFSFELGPQVLRYDGTIVAFGGTTTGTAHTSVYSTSGGTWSQGPDIPAVSGTPYTLADAPAAVMPDGTILYAASPSNWAASNSFPNPVHFFELSGSTMTQISTDATNAATRNSYQYQFVVLPTGQVLVTDGSFTVEVYTPTSLIPAAGTRPVVTSSPPCISAGGTYVASGTQFSGVSHGAAYGDDDQSNTGYPLVRIMNSATTHVVYARTFDHFNRSIAANAPGGTKFKPPQVIESGASMLYVVANGIASTGTAVTVSPQQQGNGCSKGGTTTATHDFNGSSSIPQSDIAWRDSAGNTAVWFMNGAAVADSGGFGPVATTWQIVGQRDFNGDGAHDWLWRDTGGNLVIWFLFGKLTPTVVSLGNVSTNWVVAGTGDFNGDGMGDIVWRDTNNGNVAIWLMNGSNVVSSASLGIVAGAWTIAGTGDFNGDGTVDILWRNTTTGDVAIWFMNGTTVTSAVGVGNISTTWTVAGTGDFNGDGKSDILWRDSGGNVAVWLMNASQVGAVAVLGSVPGPWVISETGDFDGDGKSDLLWRNTSTGDVAIWFMNGLQVASSAGVANVATIWTIVGLNAD